MRGTRLNRASPAAIASCYCYGVAGTALLGLLAATLSWSFDLLRTGRVGDHYPTTIYGTMTVPGTSPVAGLPGATGADFSQVYTSARALAAGRSAYIATPHHRLDVFGRPPGFPPLTNWIYVPLSYLSYSNALLLHTWFWLLALTGASALLLFKLSLLRQLWRVVLVFGSLYFLTPIGVTHFERGQFDLIVATVCVLAFSCVFAADVQFALAVLCGLLGALKWTALAFLGCLSAFFFLLSGGRRRWTYATIPLVTACATLAFWQGVHEYWPTIQTYEFDAQPFGLTLQYFLPRTVAKVVPVVLTLGVAGLVWFRARSAEGRQRLLLAVSAPFTIALLCISICYGTLSYEYHTVSLLGLVPCVVVWIEKVSLVSNRLKAITAAGVGVFQPFAFRVFGFGTGLEPRTMSVLYIAMALFATAICICVVEAAVPALTGKEVG